MDEYMAQIEQESFRLIDRAESIGLAYIGAFSAGGQQLSTMVPDFDSLPFVSLVPSPTSVVKTSYAITERALGASRRMAEAFAEALIPMTEPIMPWTEGKSVKRAERKTSSQSREAA